VSQDAEDPVLGIRDPPTDELTLASDQLEWPAGLGGLLGGGQLVDGEVGMAAGDPSKEPVGYRDRPDQSSPLRRPLEGFRPLLAFLFRNLSCCVRFLFAM
jgi:hypothetical protein